MKFITPLVVSFSLLAFAAHAADDAKKNQSQSQPSISQGAKSSGTASTGSSGSAAAGSSGSASAGASGSKSSGGSADFDRADTNKDGQLSRTEFEAMHKGARGASSGKTSSGKAPSDKAASNKPSTGAGASGGTTGSTTGSASKDSAKTAK